MIPTSQMRKLRHRELKSHSQFSEGAEPDLAYAALKQAVFAFFLQGW